ncbi:MAG TPA: M1 family metallopeptidase, partial [Pseudonocardiaceae bacterium]
GTAGDGAADAGPAAPGAGGAGDPYYPDDGNGGYDVQHYDVTIDYDPDRQRLDGDATITARATQSLSRFNLDLFALRAAEAWVDDAPAGVAREGRHELVITPATPIAEGATFRVRVRYDGQPGLFEESGLGAGGWYANETGGAVAAGEPHSATTWYPANDTPRDKATFALTATVPEGWTVISNGTDEPVSTRDGRSTFRWRLDEPVATYLTTVAIDRFTVRRSTLRDGTPVIDAYAPGAEDARADQERLPEIIEFLEEKFGPYPFDSAGGIFLSASIGYALELQTRPVYSPDPGVEIIVHENAHQWFGNSVTVSSWADICLNECFASYAQWLWNEHEGENLDERYRDLVGRVDLAVPLYDMGAGNEFRGVYGKGPLALHALRRTIGDEAFDRVLREWPERHRDGNASWPQFEAFVTEVAGRDLRGFFDAWFHGTERPADEYLHPGGL